MRDGEWCFNNHGSRKIFAEIYASRSLVFLAAKRVSQSRFLTVSQVKKSKCLGLAKKNACLSLSQSLAFIIHRPLYVELGEEARLGLFFANPRHFDFFTRETETSK